MSEKENIREIIMIGRGSDCNFIADDPSISRQHAQIIDYGTSYSVVDLGSTNGTFVNGKRVSSETTLHAGDELRVGNVIVPWQQVVQPLQKPKKHKVLLWILIPIFAVLLIGGGIATYLIYGRGKVETEDVRRELSNQQSEVVNELAEQINENQRIDSSLQESKMRNDYLEEKMKQDNIAKEKEKAKLEKQLEELNKSSQSEQVRVEEERKAWEKEKARLIKELDSINKARISDSTKMAEEIKANNKRIEQLNKQNKRYTEGEKSINSLNTTQAKDVCRNIGLKEYYYAKKALMEEWKNAFNSNDEDRIKKIQEEIDKIKKTK